MKENTLEYFITHAPAVQDWFVPVMEINPPAAPKIPEHPDFEKQYEKYNDFGMGAVEDSLVHTIEEFVALNKDWDKADRKWNLEYEKQRLLQWPLAWAKEQKKLLPLPLKRTTVADFMEPMINPNFKDGETSCTIGANSKDNRVV